MQNFRTRFRYLSLEFVEAMAAFPTYQPPNVERHGLFGAAVYTVVDLSFANGTVLTGLLAWDNQVLLPEGEAERLEEVAVIGIAATAADALPDFTITDTASVHEEGEGSIEHSNLQRLHMFGPPREEKEEVDWLHAPIPDAYEEALRNDRHITVYPEIGAVRWMSAVRLTPAGFAATVFKVGADAEMSLVVRPVSRALWAEILKYHTPRIEPGVTLRTILDLLLETPADVQSALASHLIDLEETSFARYAEALRKEPDPDEEEDAKITWTPDACVTVARVIDWDWEVDENDTTGKSVTRLTQGFDACVVASPDEGEDDTACRPDGRIHWSLTGCPLRTVIDLPFAMDLAFVVPHSTVSWDIWHRASVREPGDDRPVEDRPGPVFTGAMTFTWDEVLRALFDELPAW